MSLNWFFLNRKFDNNWACVGCEQQNLVIYRRSNKLFLQITLLALLSLMSLGLKIQTIEWTYKIENRYKILEGSIPSRCYIFISIFCHLSTIKIFFFFLFHESSDLSQKNLEKRFVFVCFWRNWKLKMSIYTLTIYFFLSIQCFFSV